MNLRGLFPWSWHLQTPRLNAGLFRGPGRNKLAGLDERKRLGRVAALKIDRLVIGAVDMNHLAWI